MPSSSSEDDGEPPSARALPARLGDRLSSGSPSRVPMPPPPMPPAPATPAVPVAAAGLRSYAHETRGTSPSAATALACFARCSAARSRSLRCLSLSLSLALPNPSRSPDRPGSQSLLSESCASLVSSSSSPSPSAPKPKRQPLPLPAPRAVSLPCQPPEVLPLSLLPSGPPPRPLRDDAVPLPPVASASARASRRFGRLNEMMRTDAPRDDVAGATRISRTSSKAPSPLPAIRRRALP